MLSHLFLGMSLIGAEWVLYLLLVLSVLSITLIIERIFFYRSASQGLDLFRKQVRTAASSGNWNEAAKAAESRAQSQKGAAVDLEAEMTSSLVGSSKKSIEVLNELAYDSVIRARISWDKNLALLATIGANAPFLGLFGTVLGIIKAFHDLSQQAATGAAGVTAGISEALIATAIGILVAIPAAVAYNIFSRRVKSAVAEAEALKSFLIGKLGQ